MAVPYRDPRSNPGTSRSGEGETEHDPFQSALVAAEEDDEPFTDEERAAMQEGLEAFSRGEFTTLDDLLHELAEEGDPAVTPSP